MAHRPPWGSLCVRAHTHVHGLVEGLVRGAFLEAATMAHTPTPRGIQALEGISEDGWRVGEWLRSLYSPPH